jgi:hypothetical protein
MEFFGCEQAIIGINYDQSSRLNLNKIVHALKTAYL